MTGAVVFYLVYRGSLKFGDTPLNFSSLIFNLLLWSIVNGTILAVIANRIPLKPVDKTLEALDRLSSGDYSARLHFQGPFSRLPVVVELTENFNKMASELQQTALLRSDFINNFSHEYKTPIVSITGFARLLKRGNLTEEKREEYLNIIETESMRLSQLATNILNLTRVENQNILTDVRVFNLTEQIRTSALVLEGKWTKKHIELLLPADEVYAAGDEDLLKHVWVNLLDNAIKFSPDYGTVEVRIKSESDQISTTVSNFGDPIPEKSIDKIFNKFYQADDLIMRQIFTGRRNGRIVRGAPLFRAPALSQRSTTHSESRPLQALKNKRTQEKPVASFAGKGNLHKVSKNKLNQYSTLQIFL